MCVRLALPIPWPSSLRTLPVTLCMTRDLPVVMYAPRARGVKSPLHFLGVLVLHAKMGVGRGSR